MLRWIVDWTLCGLISDAGDCSVCSVFTSHFGQENDKPIREINEHREIIGHAQLDVSRYLVFSSGTLCVCTIRVVAASRLDLGCRKVRRHQILIRFSNSQIYL